MITDIVYDPPDALSEYVAIANRGGAALDMTGWTLSDLAGNTYTLSDVINPGATVVVRLIVGCEGYVPLVTR
jgi:hypothetical protein